MPASASARRDESAMTQAQTMQKSILAQKEALAGRIKTRLAEVADDCVAAWPDADRLDEILQRAIGEIPDCGSLYAWDFEGHEISSMIRRDGRDPSWRGRDLTRRPYLTQHLPFMGIMLSSVYRSDYDGRECITALQAVNADNRLLGFIAADFPVSELLRSKGLEVELPRWTQHRGDPAVRGTLFMQQRVPSRLDEHIDEVLERFVSLIAEHGVFHCKIHFSSGRCSIWLMEDPYSYRILSVDEVLNPDLSLVYPCRPYPAQAVVTPDEVRECFQRFRELRFADEVIYLRSSSINIINGMIGLTFSCDGSHYMPVSEFIAKDASFWFGALPQR